MTHAAWERARAAEAAARRELAAVPDWLWNGTSLPVPVEVLADSHYGLFVEEARDLWTRLIVPEDVHLSGLLQPADRLIVVDEEEAARAPGRRRFTIAHELGHWVLHCSALSAPPVYCRNVSVREDTDPGQSADAAPSALLEYPPSELEANQFAAAILMPRELLLAQPRPRTDDGDHDLAREFGVSREALRRRLWSIDQGI
jgi:hypothetical protein